MSKQWSKYRWNCSVGEIKLLVGREDKSKHVFCHMCKCKGLGDDRIVDKIMRSTSDTGNTKIVLKTDGEPALVQAQDRIISMRTQPTIPENPSACDHRRMEVLKEEFKK